MMANGWDTESIVREVLRRLALVAESPSNASAANARASQPSPARELSLGDRVITLAVLDGKLDGVQRLVTSRNTIITPAARDELRQRQIEWVRAGDRLRTNGSDKSSDKGQERKLLALLLASDNSDVPLNEWQDKTRACETYSQTELPQLARRIAGWVDARHVAVVWSREPWRVVCRLNKEPSLRAVTIDCSKQIHRAIQEAGANVMVLDSATSADWAAWIDSFRGTGDRIEPK